MTEPLPCPFCRSEEVAVDFDTEAVMCGACAATGPTMLSKDQISEAAMIEGAITAWNKAPRT